MRQKYQSGFGHLVIITVVLALALVGALGYIFYQNFIQTKNSVSSVKTNNDSKPKTNTGTDNTSNTDPNKGYLVLSDWGVKFKLNDSLKNTQVKYYKVSDSDWGDVYEFTTSRVEALGEGCVVTHSVLGDQGATRLASLFRLNKPNTIEASPPILIRQIDDYYYYYRGAQATCSSTGLDLQSADLTNVVDMLKGLEKA